MQILINKKNGLNRSKIENLTFLEKKNGESTYALSLGWNKKAQKAHKGIIWVDSVSDVATAETLSERKQEQVIGDWESEGEMGTRQVYEEKLRRANLEYDPTMNPGLGSARCPRCLSLLTPNQVKPSQLVFSSQYPFVFLGLS